MRYRLEIKRKALKRIQRLPADVQRAIREVIDDLAAHPRSADCKKLRGTENYSIRSGTYRIMYNIQNEILVIVVIDAGHRTHIYRTL